LLVRSHSTATNLRPLFQDTINKKHIVLYGDDKEDRELSNIESSEPSKQTSKQTMADSQQEDDDRKPAARPVGATTAESPSSEMKEKLAEMQAYLESLPPDTKASYVQALEQAPALVQTETDPRRFLRHTRYDAAAAARLLAAHWTQRRALFKDKAFLPLALTGEGALHRTDMALLSCGFLVVLPHSRHTQARSVLCYDAARLEKQAAKEYQLRVAFYLLAVACENEQSQLEGLVLLFLMEGGDTGAVRSAGSSSTGGRAKKQMLLQEVLQVMPCRIEKVYGVRIVPPKTEQQPQLPSALKKMSAAVSAVFGPTAAALDRLVLVQGTKESCVAQLELAAGLNRAGIPKSMGGDWGYESFVQWQEMRTRFEWGLPPGVGGKDSASLFDFAHSTINLKTLTEEEKTERKRRLNVLHSRRKREREKVEIEVLQEQVVEFEEKNRSLEDDNERLETLLRQAHNMVSSSGSERSGSSGGGGGAAAAAYPAHQQPSPPLFAQHPQLSRGGGSTQQQRQQFRDALEGESKMSHHSSISPERQYYQQLMQQQQEPQQQHPGSFNNMQDLLALSHLFQGQQQPAPIASQGNIRQALLQQLQLRELQRQLAARGTLMDQLLLQQQQQQQQSRQLAADQQRQFEQDYDSSSAEDAKDPRSGAGPAYRPPS